VSDPFSFLLIAKNTELSLTNKISLQQDFIPSVRNKKAPSYLGRGCVDVLHNLNHHQDNLFLEELAL